MASRFKQDMPPEGGYGPINIKRIAPKTYFSGAGLFATIAGVTAFSFYMYSRQLKVLRYRKIERDDTHIALEPFILAERDRMYLKQLKKNYEAEKEIMKDVPGWKVGTFYGEKVYKTTPADYHVDPSVNEYYAHVSPWEAQCQWNYGFKKFHLF